MSFRALRVIFASFAYGCLVFPAFANDALWTLLKSGGQVVLVRHALTTPGVGDPDGMVLTDCKTQRNLSNEGRDHAKLVGDSFRARRIPIGQVVSSPWCRCIDTATLAFGIKPETSAALGNLFGRGDQQATQIEQLKPLVARRPQTGNTIMVSHGSTIFALTDTMPAMGEMVVLTPLGEGRFRVAGRLQVPAR